jgi:hypothetical protein
MGGSCGLSELALPAVITLHHVPSVPSCGLAEIDSTISLYIIAGLCLIDLFPMSISHQNRCLAVDRLHGKEGHICTYQGDMKWCPAL